MAEDKISNLYKTFVNEGYEMEPEEKFRQNLNDPKRRRAAYDALVSSGYEMEPYGEFERNIGYGGSERPLAGATGDKSAGAASRPQAGDAGNEGSSGSEAGGALGDVFRGAIAGASGLQAGGSEYTQADKPAGGDLDSEDSEAGASGDKSDGWGLSEQEKIRRMYELKRGVDASLRRLKESKERSERTAGRSTAEGRRTLGARRFAAELAGAPTKLQGWGGSSAEKNAVGEGVSEPGGKETPNVLSPEPYGVRIVDGRQVTEWLMPDGSLTTDLSRAEATEHAARENRGLAERMRVSGLDFFNEDDRKSQSMIDAIITGSGLNPEEREKILSAIRADGLDPADPKHVAWAVKGEERKILEFRLQKAEENLKELNRQRVEEDNERARSGGWLNNLGHQVGEATRAMHPTPRGSHAGVSERPLDRDIEYATAEVTALRRALDRYDSRQKAAGLPWYGKIAQGLWDGLTDANSWAMYVPEMSVGASVAASTSDTRGHRLGESWARGEQLVGSAANPGALYEGAEFFGEMMKDPLMYFSGAIGGGAERAASRVIAGGAAKGMTKPVAERFAMSSVVNRIASKGVGGGVNFGLFDGLRDARQQMIDGGWTDSKNRFHEGFSLPHVLERGGHGLVMGLGMGIWGAGIGNAGDWLVTAPGAGAVVKTSVRAGQHLASFGGEALIFAMPEIYEFHTMKDGEFDELYADKFGYADEKDSEKRAAAREEARESLQWDAFTQSAAQLAAMKISGKVMNTAGVVRHASEVIDELRGADANRNMTFAERVSRMMDRSPFDVALSKSDKEELRKFGYDDLADLFVRDEVKDRRGAEGRRNAEKTQGARAQERDFEEAAEAEPGESVDERGVVVASGRDLTVPPKPRLRAVAPDDVDPTPHVDGYLELDALVHDTRISEGVRAKLYFIATGHMLPMSTIMSYTVNRDADGNFEVLSMSQDGSLVTRMITRDKAEVKEAEKALARQIEMNSVEAGEMERERDARSRLLDIAIRAVRPEWDPETVRRNYAAVKAGEDLGEPMERVVREIDDFIAQNPDAANEFRPEAMRARIKRESGMDVDDALKKNAPDRSEAEAEVVDRYFRMLYPEEAARREAERASAETVEEVMEQPRLAYDAGCRIYEESDGSMDPETAAQVDGAVECLREAEEEIRDLFEDPEEVLSRLSDDPRGVIADLVESGRMDDVEAQAILEYVNARSVIEGLNRAAAEGLEERKEAVRNEVAARTHKDGLIHRAIMKVGDRRVFVVNGDVVMFEDGSDVDHARSSESVVIVDEETGKTEFASPDQILSVEAGYDPQDELQASYDTIEAEHQAMFSNIAKSETKNLERKGREVSENSVTSQYENGSEQDNGLSHENEWANAGGSVAIDSARSVEGDRDRSDIRVYESGLGAERNEYSEYSERTRRNAEAERLIGIARQQGQYVDKSEYAKLGTKYPRHSGESEVYTNKAEGKVYKIKDPAAKAAMKGGVQPEDAIYEHLVHNKYFPETRYQFEGISDDMGDLRIVLSQGYIDAVDNATDKQIEAALAEKGLMPEGRYTYGNEEITVTDVMGDNALLGADGKVYFIDPIIDFKKPVKEIIGEYNAVPENAESVPNIAENTENPTINRELISESGPNSVNSVENGQETALSRIPVDEAGEPMFEAVDGETGWDGLLEVMRGDEPRAAKIAKKQIELAEAELERLRKKPPVRKEPKLSGSAMAMARAEQAADEQFEKDKAQYEETIEAAEAKKQAWESILGVYTSRHAEEIRRAEEAEAARRAEEQEWEEVKARMDKRLHETAEEVRDVSEAVEILKDSDPHNMEEAAAHVLMDNKVLLGDGPNAERGVRRFAGMGTTESKKLIGLFATAEKGGKSLEELSETVMEETCAEYGIPYDQSEALDALMSVLNSVETRGDILSFIVNRRIERARRTAEGVRAQWEQMEAEAIWEAYHMTPAEFSDYEEYQCEVAREALEDFDESEYNSYIADQLAERAEREAAEAAKQNEYGLETDSGPEPAAESPADGRGGEILSRQESDLTPRGGADENGSGVPQGNGDQSRDPKGSLGEAERVAGIGDESGNTGDAGRNGERAGDLAQAEEGVEPTEAQKAAGNYKMEHRRIDGYNISIENPKGSVRRGKDADGKEWQTEMHHDYGYIRGTEGVDGDHIDVFLSDTPEEGDVFVIDQRNEDGSFDEHKVMYGFPSEEAAREAYLSNYEQGWTGLGTITHVSKDEFKKWIGSSKRKTKPFAEYAGVKAVCPVCGKAGIPNYHSHDVVCPQCNSDLSVFRQIDQLPDDQAPEVLAGIEKMERNILGKSDKGDTSLRKYDRTVPTTREEQRSAISRIIDFAKSVKNRVERAVIGGITKRQAKDFADNGIEVDETWVHSFESSAVGHNQKHHGDPRIEERMGQIAITSEDYARIPDILESYDRITKSPNRSRSTGNEVIIYEKEFGDGYVYYLEEKRDNRKSLSFQTMYKKKKGTDSSDGLMPVASPSTPVAPSDNLSSSSDGKVNTFSANKQIADEQSDINVDESADKQAESAESSEPYTITPTKYEGKRKTSDVWLVKFNRQLTAEEKAAFDTFVRGPLMEGRKTSRGWFDRKQDGYMIRSEEAARQLGEMIGNEEAVADAQPLSREAIKQGAKPEEKPARKKPTPKPANTVSVEDIVEKGENKPVAPVEKPAAKGQFKVTEEMRAQEDELRKLLGIDDEEGSRDMYFRDPDELTPEQKRKVFSLGVNYAFNFLDNGVIAFPDFARAIVGRLGSKVKPFIKSWYEGAKRVPGYGGEVYTETAEVDRFDIENFDKPSPYVIRDAEMRVAERKARIAAEQAEKELIAERNEKRRKDDKQREADTEALAGKAEAVACEAEATAESARDERAVAEASEKVDKTLDKINNQLAILGYFERKGNDPVAIVERKAAEAGADLAAQLVDDLGLKLTDLPKGVDVVSSDFGEKGGYVRINLPVRSGYEPLRIDIRFDRTGNESLRLTELMTTLKRGDEQSYIIGEDRQAWLSAPTYGELISKIKEQIGKYLPKEEAFEVPEFWHDKTIAELEAMLAEILPKARGKVSKSFGMDRIARGLSEYIEKRKAKGEATDTASVPKDMAEESHNGYKRGDEVMWDRYGNGKWEKVKIEDFDTDGSPIFEAVKGIMSEKGDWSRVKPADGIFGEAKRVATKAQAERKKKSAATSGDKSSSDIEAATDKALEAVTGGRVKKSRKKNVTLKADEPVGGLFADLFLTESSGKADNLAEPSGKADNEKPETPKANEKRNGNKPGQGLAGGERAHAVGADETGTDGRVSAAGAEPTGRGGAADKARAGVERGTDGATHGADADGGLQPLVGDRGRDESDADSRSAGTGVERGGSAGAGSVSKRGADRGAEGLFEGESSSGSGRGSGSSSVKKAKKPEVRYTRNFRYDEKGGNEADSYTPSERLDANVKAIETLAEVLFGGKPATDEQRVIMSRFRGWGQVDLGKYYDIDHILRDTYQSNPLNRLAKAIKKLDPQGDKKLFDAIKRASLSSYYTPTPIARAMNTFLSLAGYKGGSLLDPSMGNGMYEGTLPKSIQERTAITGVELDWISGQLSRLLYPDANVMIGRFEESGVAPGSFDVVTSNVPFGDIVVNDPTWKNDATPLKRSAQNRIHNYYAVKMLEATRPGGLVAILTTSAVMDTPSNQNIRAHIADQGEILGAIRLPDNTFQGTGVVTDMIFIRKWRDDQDRAQTRENPAYKELEQAFLSHFEKTAPNKLDGKEEKVRLNGYFKKNPRNLIGDVQAGNQYGKRDAFGLTSKLSVDEIASEIEKGVKRIVGSRRGSLFNPTRTIREVHQAVREAYKGAGDWVSNGNLVIQDGKVGVLTAKSNEYGETTNTFEGTLKHDKMLPKIKSMIGLRTAMKKLIAGQIEGNEETTLKALRGELREAYDSFVGKYGRLQDKNNTFILDDIDGYTLQALEIWKSGKFIGLSDIFTKNSIKPALKLDGKKTPQEAVALSLAEYGYLRPDYMVKALGEDWAEQCGDFVFLKPNSVDDYVTRDEYLSGDVVSKLAEARAAAEKDESFDRNVKALEEVQPVRIPFDDITIHLGARWIPENILNDFVNDIFGIRAVRSTRNGHWDPEKREFVYNQKSGVRYIPETDSFEINIEKKELGGAASDWETPKKSAKEILQAALEDKSLLIKYKDKDGNEHIDEEQTELANQKIADLRERFESWLPSDPERVDMLEQAYNDRFNRTVKRHFDGSHLVVPGLMGKELRPHQKDAVWMLINNRGGIVDHIVGAGKTLVMQSAIMEMRRMGIAKKPMIVALKSTVSQIAREFKESFPSARVLAPNDNDFKKENRKKFIANISLNDYDCVILSHEQYCMLPHTEEAERDVIDEQMWQLDNMIAYLYGTNDSSQMTKKQIKALEKRRENLKARLQKRLDRNVDREFCFENLGIDYMFVDESHQFKSLPYVTSYQKVAGLGDAQGSSRAVALLTGIRHLQRMHQGDKGTVFLSGTTITNSLVEIYNLLNYLRPRKLEELGMPTFDAWASVFAVHSAELEAGVTGNFAMKDRFRSFDNVPELSQLYAEIADVRNDTNLKLPKPSVDGRTVIVPASDSMQEINSEIVNMLESKDGSYFDIHPKDPNRAPWGLHASTLSAKAAVSPRLIFPDMEDDGGKVHAVCENVKKFYDEQADQLGVQLIFCEMGVPDKSKKYDAYTDMVNRFVNDYGIPRSEIAYIQEANTEEKRKDLFQRVRDGKVRILIGGTKNMGTGVNVQDRITDMHMLTVPWTPSALEQCIGRGARQGNLVARDFMDNKVRVHYYATEGSLDLYKYQLLDAKGKMFTQFKMGTVNGGRSFDEGSADEDGNIDPAEMVAILSGNPVIFERAKQEKVVKKLRALRNGFERDYQRKKAKHDELKRREENLERLIRLNDLDRAGLEREGFKPDDKGIYPTTVTITEGYSRYGGRTFDKPKEAGEYLLKMLEDGKNVVLQGFGQRAQVVTVNEEGTGGLFSAHRELQIGTGEHDIKYIVRLSDDATAAGTAFRNLLKRIVDNGEVYRRELEETQSQLAGMNVGDGVFSRQAELDEAVAKLRELNAEYNKLGKQQGSGGNGNRYRDGEEMSEGERLQAIRALEPIEVKPNNLSRAELREIYNNLPAVDKDGREIEFYHSSFKKIYKDGGLFGQVVPVLDRVLEQSVLAYSEDDNLGGMMRPDGTIHKDHPNTLSFDNYVGKVNIDGMDHYVRITIQHDKGSRNGMHACFVTEVELYENAEFQATGTGNSRVKPYYSGIVDAKLQQFFERAGSELQKKEMERRVTDLSEKLNTPIKVITDRSELDAVSEDGKPLYGARQHRAKGWWDGQTGEIVVVLPNHADVADVENTVIHEIVGHKGLRAFIGEERFDEFLGEVYSHAEEAIRKKIDEMTEAMVRAEAERLQAQKRRQREEAGEDANATYYEDQAEAWAEAHRRRGAFRNEATEEYLSDLGGRIGDEGFEKMSREELTLWGRVKAKVQEFLDKFLKGLKIGKRFTLTDKDLSYILFKSWKFAKDSRAGHPDVFMEAEGVVKSRGTRFNERTRKPSWKETTQALTDTKKVSKDGTDYAQKDSRSHAEGTALTSTTLETDAKIQQISENLKSLERDMKISSLGESEIVYRIAEALGIPHASSGKSNYTELDIPVAGATTIRISNHSANPSNFGATGNNAGIVIKTANHYFREKEDIDYVEFLYYGDLVAGNAALQRRIVEGLRHYIETGDFGKMPEADRLNTSGAYRAAIEGLEDQIRFRDPDMGLEETLTKMKTEAMQANADNLQAKREAMRAIGGNLNNLRRAMARQKEYDVYTVKSVADLARVLIKADLLDSPSKLETNRILSAIKNAVGKEDVSKYADKVMDIMVANQLRAGENDFGRLIRFKGKKTDARGVEVQGQLDAEGELIRATVKKTINVPKEKIDEMIDESMDRMGSDDQTIADNAAVEYSGLLIARRYAEEIAESRVEEKEMRESIRKAKEEMDAGKMSTEAYRQYKRTTEETIRQNRIERVEAYEDLCRLMGDALIEGVERAREWRRAEKERVREIQHNANSDMEGRASDEHHKPDRVQKVVNSDIFRFVMAPLATFDQMLRMFGSKSVRGEGYLWNRYMRGWVRATENEYTGYQNALKTLDAKVKEVFSRPGAKRTGIRTWGDLFTLDRKLPKATVRFMDGGEMKDHELSQGNLLYIYMVDKMSDGRMKLRKMGITEKDVEDITNFLDPRFIEIADWMQEEFLVEKRNEYDEVYKRMFGTSMAAIDNYFPLKILANARVEEVDVAGEVTDTSLPATSTGSIIKRRRNNLALDIVGANAFSVILDHIQEMERWASFAEFNRDLNSLLSYKRFRNQVMNMSSVYGGGRKLWDGFRKVSALAAGTYRPPVADLDRTALNVAKGVTMACVSFRLFTALKQFLSMPAYIPDCNPVHLTANILNPIGAWKWSMENLPLFEKRWRSRMAGDPRLMKTDMDWKMWRSKIVEIASRIGMSPNAFVDALTVSIGARSMYQTKKAKYLRRGMSNAEAERRAKEDATILFNQTQQSSEGAFLSPMQRDGSWQSVLFTIFRNSSMSYTRQVYDALRNLGRRVKSGFKGISEEFMAKQMRREGIDPETATKEAKREYRRGILRDFVRVGIFGYGLQLLWNMGAYLPYMLVGSDDDKKKAHWNDIFTHTIFGSLEGLTGGDVMSAAGNMVVSGEGNPAYLSKDMPLASNVVDILKKMGTDNVSALNDVLNLLVQSGVGVNPQSLTDAAVAILDYCDGDAKTSRECALLIMRVMSCPQSQIDEVYFDEIDMSAREAREATPEQLAERFAMYKMMREAPITGWLREDEEREEVMAKKMKRPLAVAKKSAKSRMETPEIKQLFEDYDRVSNELKRISELRKTDPEAALEERVKLSETENLQLYRRTAIYRRDMNELTRRLLKTIDVEEKIEILKAMDAARDAYLRDVEEIMNGQ
ncbi:MAG: N-6 DNA methylase [Bacteroides sp.]|nr:N-6 DNA methylase [Bacteroides sp.]